METFHRHCEWHLVKGACVNLGIAVYRQHMYRQFSILVEYVEFMNIP